MVAHLVAGPGQRNRSIVDRHGRGDHADPAQIVIRDFDAGQRLASTRNRDGQQVDDGGAAAGRRLGLACPDVRPPGTSRRIDGVRAGRAPLAKVRPNDEVGRLRRAVAKGQDDGSDRRTSVVEVGVVAVQQNESSLRVRIRTADRRALAAGERDHLAGGEVKRMTAEHDRANRRIQVGVGDGAGSGDTKTDGNIRGEARDACRHHEAGREHKTTKRLDEGSSGVHGPYCRFRTLRAGWR